MNVRSAMFDAVLSLQLHGLVLRRRAGGLRVPGHLRRSLGGRRRLLSIVVVAVPRSVAPCSHVPGQAEPGHHRHTRQLDQADRRLRRSLLRLRSRERVLLRPHGRADSARLRTRKGTHRSADRRTRRQRRVRYHFSPKCKQTVREIIRQLSRSFMFTCF